MKQLTPLVKKQKSDFLKETVYQALSCSVSHFAPQFGEMLRQWLPHVSDVVESYLAIQSLAYMNGIMTFGLSKSEMVTWETATRSMTALHATENFSDDLFLLDDNGCPIPHLQAILHEFNQNYALPLLPKAFIPNTAHLDRALTSIDYLDFSDYQFPIQRTARHLLPELQKMTKHTAIDATTRSALETFYYKPVNFSLKLNLVSTYLTGMQLTRLHTRLDGRLSMLYESGYAALQQRYEAGQILLHQPFTDIEQAFDLAIDTILVNYSAVHNILGRAVANPDVARLLARRENQRHLLEAIYRVTLDIRCTNDAGLLLFAPDDALREIISQLRDTFGADCTPRQILRKLHTSSQDWTIKHLFSRQIKDAVDGEYNLLLNAGADPNQTADELWETWFNNRQYVAQQYHPARKEAGALLKDIARVLPHIAYSLGTFAYFNYELYAQPAHEGDYDTHFGAWHALESLQSRHAWQMHYKS